MYSLDCSYYTAEFATVAELLNHILISGQDPDYEVTRDGKGTGYTAADLITY